MNLAVIFGFLLEMFGDVIAEFLMELFTLALARAYQFARSMIL